MSNYGFNFRDSSGFVTDGANETYAISEDYPQTRNGITFGYTARPNLNTRDRNSGNDRRLAGCHFNAGGVDSVFRVDLPSAGSWDIRLALGDASNGQVINIELKDNTTSLLTIVNVDTTAANNFLDATGAILSAANWPANNTKVTKTFASTILNLIIKTPTSAASAVAHMLISQSAAAGVSAKRSQFLTMFPV